MAESTPLRGVQPLDAELIRVCAEHPARIAAYNAGSGGLDFDSDPLWLAYEQSRDFITAAKPLTLEGMLAMGNARASFLRGHGDPTSASMNTAKPLR